jgi:hypothetical protein
MPPFQKKKQTTYLGSTPRGEGKELHLLDWIILNRSHKAGFSTGAIWREKVPLKVLRLGPG